MFGVMQVNQVMEV